MNATRWANLFLAAIGAIVLTLAMKLSWLASHSTTGCETLAGQWRDATWGLVAGKHEPIAARDPDRQAAFWLAEVDRILAADPSDAELTMGAALVLDGPANDYYVRFVRHFKESGFERYEVDYDAVRRQVDAFERACNGRCLDLARRAGQLKPDNLAWSRLRALLLWRKWSWGWRNEVFNRESDWPGVLAECAALDPQNALYDYQAAVAHFKPSVEFLPAINWSTTLFIRDRAEFERGVACIDRGLAKTDFAVGDADLVAVRRFFARTSLTQLEQARIIGRQFIRKRYGDLMQEIDHWMGALAEERFLADDHIGAMRLSKERLRIHEQFGRGGRHLAYSFTSHRLKVQATDQIDELIEKRGYVEHEDVAAKFRAMKFEARVDDLVARRALSDFNYYSHGRNRFWPQFRHLAIETFPRGILVIFALAIAGECVARIFRAHREDGVSPLQQGAALAGAFALCVILFSLAAGEIIPRIVQSWYLTAVFALTPLALTAAVAFGAHRTGEFRFSLGSLFLVLLACCAALGVLAFTSAGAESFATFPFDLAIPAHRGSEWEFAQSRGRVSRAIYQWKGHGGLYLTLAFWFAITLAFSAHRCVIARRQSPKSWKLASIVGAMLHSIRRPLWLAGAVLLVVYLAAAIEIVGANEREFLQRTAVARDPQAFWSEANRKLRVFRANDDAMQKTRNDVANQMARER